MLSKVQNLLPVRFKPFDDELFTSWLVRLARENGTKLQTFSSVLFAEKRIWSRDLDKSADDRHLAVMQKSTDFAPEVIDATFLRSFAGKFYESHNARGNSTWLMPLGVFHATRQNCGLQMCPACLREDGENSYYRKHWRISWVTICEKHSVVLLDCCPNCAAPIVFHRGEMGYRNLFSHSSNVRCSKCEFYWTANKFIDQLAPAHPEAIRFQKRLKTAVSEQWTIINNFGAVHAIAFFNGLKQIVKLLSISRRSRGFREAVRLRTGLPLNEITGGLCSFDSLPIETRYQTLRAADWLLGDWSKRFVEVAEACRTWSSTLLADSRETPFWFWSPVHDFLTRQTHYTTEAEIFAALAYLKKHFDLLLPSQLERLIGKPCLFEKRSGSFIASIYEQMKKHNGKVENERLRKVREQAKSLGTNCSKTRARKLYRSFRKDNARPAFAFRRTQAMLDRLIVAHRRRERFKMVKAMENIGVASVVAEQFGVTYPIVLKWYCRYQQHGVAGLDDRSRSPHTFRHQIVFEREEEWIRELHSEGLELSQIRSELLRRYNFSITDGGLYRALNRMKLILPKSKKFRANS